MNQETSATDLVVYFLPDIEPLNQTIVWEPAEEQEEKE